jgi:dTDP-4-amino-4,6-dideoxygalactose transaminase
MLVSLIKPDLPDLASIASSLAEVLDSGKITNFGRYVTEFEREAAAYLGVADAVTTSSGTMGLVLTLQALGLEPGQKVVLPSFTFMATAQAVLYAGGMPLFAEIEDDLTLSPTDLQALLEKHDDVRVILPVHTYGLPCRVADIQGVVESQGPRRRGALSVLYDAAHAFGSEAEGKRIGGFGDAEVFSLSVTKVLVSVEGGLVASHNPELLGRIRKMRNYGMESSYDAHWPGLNGKMSELHAIVGLYNLKRLPDLVARRQEKARYYLDRIRGETGFGTLPWPDGVVHTFKDFTVLVPEPLASERDAIIATLREAGVETRAYFHPPVHQQRFFRRFAERSLPRTEALAARVITLPFYSSITEQEMDFVAASLGEAEEKHRSV